MYYLGPWRVEVLFLEGNGRSSGQCGISNQGKLRSCSEAVAAFKLRVEHLVWQGIRGCVLFQGACLQFPDTLNSTELGGLQAVHGETVVGRRRCHILHCTSSLTAIATHAKAT